jgi:hypothetical protein
MGRLYYQAKELLLSQGFDFFKPKEEERNTFIPILLNVMIKISAMQYHLKKYEQQEAFHIEQIKTKVDAERPIAMTAYDLLFELEAFLFQMKSALDLAVKFFKPLFPNRIKTKTFGSMGKNLIKGLEQFKKDKTAKKEIVDSIISMIKDDQKTWLKQAITLRNHLNHNYTIPGYGYQAHKYGNKWDIIGPRIEEIDVLTYMKMIYSNCLEFIQEFMCLVIGMFLPKPVYVGLKSSNISCIGEPFNQYIKYGWGLNTILDDGFKSGAGNIIDQEKKTLKKNPVDTE